MTYSSLCFSIALVAIVALVAVGCGAPSATETPSEPQATQNDMHDMHADHDHAAHTDQGATGMSDMDQMKSELAKLSPEDADSAMKQHFCPVSGEMLGVMGAPIKVDVNGKQVWICCEGCRDKLLADPDKYLAKLEN
ncbi:hypothetical protein [Aeoliella sp.]|uniref:hypothetical protein n=1 Tax=Aeoliella sp. TaxID=2795800 RepID=UPI003CCBBEC4